MIRTGLLNKVNLLSISICKVNNHHDNSKTYLQFTTTTCRMKKYLVNCICSVQHLFWNGNLFGSRITRCPGKMSVPLMATSAESWHIKSTALGGRLLLLTRCWRYMMQLPAMLN